MRPPLVSAALIVRDEARHLANCLASIRGFADEVIVVDTGSRDATPEIARAVGAKVYVVPWADDFAAARNAALERCRGRWILYIDADERIVPGTAEGVRELLEKPEMIGCRLWLRAAAGCTAYREIRLFRNHPSIRFEGVIHENIWPAILRVMTAEGGAIGDCELTLDHVGYHGPQDHKHRRNLPLLLKKLEQDPEHSYSRWHLGACYNGLGDVERAREAWCIGIEAARRRFDRDWSDAGCYIGLIQLDFERPDVAGPLLDEAMQRFPDHPQLFWLKAQLLMRSERFTEAIPVLEDLAAWRSRPRASDGIVGANERFFDLFAHDGLATCHWRLKTYEEAARHYGLAEAAAPKPLEYRVKRQLCLQLAAKTGSAVEHAVPSAGGVPDLEIGQPVAAMTHVARH